LALLSTHYRDPLDWTEDRLKQAKQALDRFYRTLLEDTPTEPAEAKISEKLLAALDDDLNTPLAIRSLHELTGAFYQTHDPFERARLKAELRASGSLIGLIESDPLGWLHGDWSNQGALIWHWSTNPAPIRPPPPRWMSGITTSDTPLPLREWANRIQERINDRALARKERRFADADRIRAELEAEGILLEDHSDRPTTWRTK
jgi:cysteinyl-tRNA synthetase